MILLPASLVITIFVVLICARVQFIVEEPYVAVKSAYWEISFSGAYNLSFSTHVPANSGNYFAARKHAMPDPPLAPNVTP